MKLTAVIIDCHAEPAPQRPYWAVVQIIDRLTITGSTASSTVSVSLSTLGTDFFATKNISEWITKVLCCCYGYKRMDCLSWQ
jgi:hypothetical protein